jgi:hypothetical protein
MSPTFKKQQIEIVSEQDINEPLKVSQNKVKGSVKKQASFKQPSLKTSVISGP